MVMLTVLLLWAVVAVVVLGLCAAASLGDRKEAVVLLRAVVPREAP